jgi:hypothetical protein
LALAATCAAQDSRPASAPATAKKREGGFHGITFCERQHEGQPVLEVTAVAKGSDAERLGFAKGDLILGVDGQRLRNGDHFIQMLYATVPELRGRMGSGDARNGKSSISVLRGRERVEIAGGLNELDQHPQVGEPAPGFTLSDPAGERRVSLAALVGKKPVVLVFGSFT